jgi:hypothetical protein
VRLADRSLGVPPRNLHSLSFSLPSSPLRSIAHHISVVNREKRIYVHPPPPFLVPKGRNGLAEASPLGLLVVAVIQVRHFSGYHDELIAVRREHGDRQSHRVTALIEGSPEYFDHRDPAVLRQVKEQGL